jgi:UDP-N-acetylglucosamine diphosphorylase / glucose-1-phosphate thymidylyltransferase / UDP-N-acetylgalactosamine diphosphorylase / glucosamine-1-phosphate N-acetyltransferase / galactosamine-1-phosphate N-acetyltransferase
MSKLKNAKDIKTIILCGGIGKRMFPIETDKSLLKFNGIPLIIHQIKSAKNAGLDNFIIVCNEFNRAQLEAVMEDVPGVNADFLIQPDASGMAGAILTCASNIDNDPFILVSSNDIFDTSAYINIINQYENDADCTAYITARKVEHYFPGGYLDIDENGYINSIIEKPEPGKQPSDFVNIVLHLHSRPDLLLEHLKNTDSDKDDVYEKALNIMLTNQHKMKAVPYESSWCAIKYPWHILEVMQYFLDKLESWKSSKVTIADRVTIHGKVFIGENVRILEGATIRGPSYIGKNSVIGNNVLIRNSYIGEDCVIGYNTEVKQSYINDGCWFHSNYVGDSVIDKNCSLGAGTVTANFRLDESEIELKLDDKRINTGHDKLGIFLGAHCRVGINTSIMPGIRIGANSIIGPHLNIEQDIDSGKRVIGNFRYVMVDNTTNIIEDKRTKLYKKIM